MNNGKRIIIRNKRMSDAKEDYAWQTDPELAQLDAALTLKMSYQQFLSEYTFELCYPSNNRYEFAIETLSGEHIGNCVYYSVNVIERKAELGIMIGNRHYWNNGYGVEAIESLLDYIYKRTGLERIYLTTLDWNIRAQKCFKKCGFSPCGEIERDGSSFLLMVIHRREWEALHSQSSLSEDTAAKSE
jgi:RimJ/RimL family protein N-acetyltransferase